MAQTLKPLYGNRTQLTTTGFDSLGNGSVMTSSAFDNSSSLYQDVLAEINVAGTAAATAWLDVRLLPSEDNSNFGTWESAIPLCLINLSVSPQLVITSVCGAAGLYQLPKYFKIAVKNNSGAVLSGSGNTIYTQGINVQAV